MAAQIIDGDALAAKMLAELKGDIEKLTAEGRQPHLVAVRANDDPGTGWYAKAQAGHCEEHGIRHTVDDLGAEASEADIIAAINRHNEDPEVSAILVFLPLPKGVDSLKITEAIRPEKDAEGVHPVNLGKLLATGSSDPAPCTAMSAVELVKSVCPELKGGRAL
ncbi:MAG: bifunctional 5,10-methylenetetrahydrofolate dehydrogenase/5,10-methenyltetrahydrofolate cyclohydrolase, partial [Planctomycetes bacterium]|nr:bifunctional 5,10-methylenetetrahydrofolate dehydrogenase/5,10-methenyltetrahydrofolate cyclohydrolase [Planctomycetota bacterium]